MLNFPSALKRPRLQKERVYLPGHVISYPNQKRIMLIRLGFFTCKLELKSFIVGIQHQNNCDDKIHILCATTISIATLGITTLSVTTLHNYMT